MKRDFIKKEDAIRLLNQGWEIFTERNENTGAKGQLIYSSLTYVLGYPNKPYKSIHHSTISSLIKDNVIYGYNEAIKTGHSKYSLKTKTPAVTGIQ